MPNNAPTIVNPGTQTNNTGVAVNLAISASDADGNPLTYSASGLPAGLSINTGTGRITGTPTTKQVRSVVVTVNDGQATASATFTWNILTPDTTAPTIPANFSAVENSGGRPALSWSASTDAVGVTGYSIRRSTNGAEGPEVARTYEPLVDGQQLPGGCPIHLRRAGIRRGRQPERPHVVEERHAGSGSVDTWERDHLAVER